MERVKELKGITQELTVLDENNVFTASLIMIFDTKYEIKLGHINIPQTSNLRANGDSAVTMPGERMT